MFLSSFMNDAAASHGHEFSSGQRPPSPSKRSPIRSLTLPRSPFRPLSLQPENRAGTLPLPLPVVTSARAGDLLFMEPAAKKVHVNVARAKVEDISTGEEELSSEEEEVDDSPDVVLPTVRRPQLASPTGTIRRTCDRNIRTRRPKTTFNLAHPPPKGSAIKKARAVLSSDVVLQLFKVSASCRPTPAFEVIHSSLFNNSLSKSCSLLHPKRKLGHEDMVILEAEDYANPTKQTKACSRWEGRRILAVICVCEKETRVMMEGAAWTAKTLPNGRYDFVPSTETDYFGNATEVRWVQRRQRANTGRSMKSMMQKNEQTFTFSTISPDCRRHPVIASMSRSQLEVLDEYALPTSTSSETSSIFSSDDRRDSGRMSAGTPLSPTGPRVPTEESLREIIVATGAWVAFKEGWCRPLSEEATSAKGLAAPTPTERPLSMQIPPSRSNSTAKHLRRLSCTSMDVSSPSPEPKNHADEKEKKKRKGFRRVFGVFMKEKYR